MVREVQRRSHPIHANANIELKKVEALWADDRSVAQCFADHGWLDRDDLRVLPRSALLGSVELRGVHRAQAVRAAKVDPSAAIRLPRHRVDRRSPPSDPATAQPLPSR